MTVATASLRQKLNVSGSLRDLLDNAPNVITANTTQDLIDLALRDADDRGWAEVAYEVPGQGRVTEARVCKVRNGIAANYLEPYMRRRDPDCTVIGDSQSSDKVRYEDRYGEPFDAMRQRTFEWLKTQELAVFAFYAGVETSNLLTLAICPANAGFFALGLSLLQGIVPLEDLDDHSTPRAVIYVAPPFRHTHFDGKQVVVHNRKDHLHELFSYNLYPGPSAKKGVYGMLLNLGEQEGWVTAHCSTVQVVTPYDNRVVFMHEGASGGGKSEMLEHVHRESDGRLLLGQNVVTGEKRHITLARGCDLHPVTDDMALCLRLGTERDKKLVVADAEDAWFVRVNHIDGYGTDPHLEGVTVQPPEPLLFLNINAVPGGHALIWDHVEDEPGTPCPNPRVIVPRRIVPNVIDHEMMVDVRSFGVRTPPCTREKPTFGIFGLFHVLPPSLAWLWRLVAPRGHANPSIVSKGSGMESEGVGSYWPFATGRRVDQANLLLDQFRKTTDTVFVLIPNQHIGAWKTGFMPQWLVREYLARRGKGQFREDQVMPARCSLLGYTPTTLQIEGTIIGHWFLQVETQPEVGEEAYDAGAKILTEFFHEQLRQFIHPEMDPLGQKIIQACLDGATIQEYDGLIEVA